MAKVILSVRQDGSFDVVMAERETFEELERLGLKGAKVVRLRDEPDVPTDLRSRIAAVVRFGGTSKYDVTATIRLHRTVPRETRAVVTVPLEWLQRADG